MMTAKWSSENIVPTQCFGKYFHDIQPENDEFGGFSKEYYNPFIKKDYSKTLFEKSIERAKMTKASIDTQTGGAGTAGTALVPVYPDRQIVDRTDKEIVLRYMLPRRAVMGATYDYNALTAKGGADWHQENASIPESVDTYDRASVAIKYLYAKGTVSGPAIAAMKGYIDPQQLDLTVKTKAMIEAEEDMIINGDASTYPNQPNGLIQTITTNTTNLSSAYPTLSQIRAEFATSYNNNGSVTVAITDASTHNYVKGLLGSFQMQIKDPSTERLGFGINGAFEFDGVMFARSRFMPTTTNGKRILFLDMRYIFIAELQGMTFEIKMSENDNYPYLLKEYLTFVNTFEASCTQMYGII